MNYETQKRYLSDVIRRKPEFGKKLLLYRRVFMNTQLKNFWIVVGGNPIADHVILKLNIEELLL